MINFERIFIQEEARDHGDINLILDSFPGATVHYYGKDRELPRGGEWAEGINRGKKPWFWLIEEQILSVGLSTRIKESTVDSFTSWQ